eukprot:15344921-Ditylum_brightwellii.AAC.1
MREIRWKQISPKWPNNPPMTHPILQTNPKRHITFCFEASQESTTLCSMPIYQGPKESIEDKRNPKTIRKGTHKTPDKGTSADRMISHQPGLIPQTLSAQDSYERAMHSYGHKVEAYHGDYSRFDSQDFKDSCDKTQQTYSYCGVGVCHQNGIADAMNKRLPHSARTILFHTKRKWPVSSHPSYGHSATSVLRNVTIFLTSILKD